MVFNVKDTVVYGERLLDNCGGG